MYKIGELAAIARVSIKAIKLYEKFGLLLPQAVSPANGYRYYTDDQLQRLLVIVELKRLGFSLAQIKEMQYEDLAEMYRLRMLQIDREIAARQAARYALERKLAKLALNETADATGIKPVIGELPPMKMFSLRKIIVIDELDGLLDEFETVLMSKGMRCEGSLMLRFREEDEMMVGVADTEVFAAIAEGDWPDSSLLSVPAVRYVGAEVTLSESDIRYDALLDECYIQLAAWISDNGLRCVGSPFEIIREKARKTDICGKSRFEICYPVE